MARTGSEIDQRNQSLLGHLVELKARLVRALWFIVAGTIGTYSISEKVFEFIRKPIAPYLPSGGLVFTGPADKFIAHLKISLFGGLILSCPFWFYQLWKFIAPGLYKNERRYTLGFIFSAVVLFLVGCAFSYFIALPFAFEFLLGFGGNIDKPMITIDQYMSFFLLTTLMFGASFEMPLVIVVLGMMGLVSAKFLREKRRFAVVGIAIVSAVITPPDLMSMLLMLIPMLVLYEISILIVGFFEKKREIN
jgi:sec-independent protein translocase protein TatC